MLLEDVNMMLYTRLIRLARNAMHSLANLIYSTVINFLVETIAVHIATFLVKTHNIINLQCDCQILSGQIATDVHNYNFKTTTLKIPASAWRSSKALLYNVYISLSYCSLDIIRRWTVTITRWCWQWRTP